MLGVAVFALFLGPILFRLIQRFKPLVPALNGFVLMSVGGLVLLHVFPESVAQVGLLALIPAGVGLILPAFLERRMADQDLARVTVALLLVGLLVHGAIDGVALGCSDSMHVAASLAVLVHRLPESLLIWSVVQPRWGIKIAFGVLGLQALATMVGFGFGEHALSLTGGQGVAWFQAFLSGFVLHVVADHMPQGAPRSREASRYDTPLETLGGLFAILLLFMLPEHGHGPPEAHSYLNRLWGLILESAPALVLGYALSGLVTVFLPRASLGWLGRGGPMAQATKGVIFGLPVPICSCGVVPLYQSLVSRGAPAAAGLALLVATPELGVESVILSLPLLGTEMALSRVIAAAVVAVLVGWWVGQRVAPIEPQSSEADGEQAPGLLKGLAQALKHGFTDVVDMTGTWILLGLLIAALMTPEDFAWMQSIPSWLQVPAFVLLGLPLYVCASGATPLAAGLLIAGVSPGAVLAFLIAGPATNVTTFGMLSKIHGKKVALWFGASMALLATAAGLIVNAIGEGWAGTGGAGHGEHAGPLAIISAGILGLAFLVSMFRQGPVRWLGSLVGAGEGHGHSHGGGCGDGCGDSCGGGGHSGGGCGCGDAHGHGHHHAHEHHHAHGHAEAHGGGSGCGGGGCCSSGGCGCKDGHRH